MTIGLIANSDGTGSLQLGGSNAITLDTSLNATMAGYVNAPNTFGFKNRIINGNMTIDQRNSGAAVTVNVGSQVYTVDRWFAQATASSGVFTVQRSTTAPSGFINSLVATVSTTDSSLAATDLYLLSQSIEGINVADLGWGTASAATVTLSFWVRSSVTGTYGGSIVNSAVNRSYPFTYTISAANTFEYKTITIPGDTSGTWLTDNGVGIRVYFGLGMGSTYSGTANAWASAFYISATGATNLMATSGATLYITGVQFEKGSKATSFDYRPYVTELQLCQRYLPVSTVGSYINGQLSSAVNGYFTTPFQVYARTSPTTISTSGTITSNAITNAAAAQLATTAIIYNVASNNTGTLQVTVAGGGVAGNASILLLFNSTIFWNGCEL